MFAILITQGINFISFIDQTLTWRQCWNLFEAGEKEELFVILEKRSLAKIIEILKNYDLVIYGELESLILVFLAKGVIPSRGRGLGKFSCSLALNT